MKQRFVSICRDIVVDSSAAVQKKNKSKKRVAQKKMIVSVGIYPSLSSLSRSLARARRSKGLSRLLAAVDNSARISVAARVGPSQRQTFDALPERSVPHTIIIIPVHGCNSRWLLLGATRGGSLSLSLYLLPLRTKQQDARLLTGCESLAPSRDYQFGITRSPTRRDGAREREREEMMRKSRDGGRESADYQLLKAGRSSCI